MSNSEGIIVRFKGLTAHTLFSWKHAVVFMLCSALFFLSQFYRSSNAIIAPELLRDLSLSPDSLGSLSAAFFYAFAVAQIPLALILDKIGARPIMTALTLVGAVGACLFAGSQSMSGAITARLMLGFGMAGNLMGGMKLFTQWFSPREFATLSGLLVACGTFGNIASSTPLAFLAGSLGWRMTFVLAGAGTALLAIIFYITVKDGPYSDIKTSIVRTGGPGIRTHLKVLFGSRDYWLISCGTFFRYGTLMAIQGLWAGPYLISYLHLSSLAAGNLLVLTNVGYIVGCPVGGWFSDRVLSSRRKMVIIGLAGMALSELSLTVGCGNASTLFLALVFFFLGLFAGLGNVMYAHIKGIMPIEMSGMALTGINFFTMLGVGLYIQMMGRLLDVLAAGSQLSAQGFRAAFFLTFLGVLLASILYFFTHESREWDNCASELPPSSH